jgi:hypothetical protein
MNGRTSAKGCFQYLRDGFDAEQARRAVGRIWIFARLFLRFSGCDRTRTETDFLLRVLAEPLFFDGAIQLLP